MTFRIFVFSDSHRYVRNMYAAMEDGKPDLVLHLGDMLRDAEELSYAYPQQSIVMVPGNCDGWTTHCFLNSAGRPVSLKKALPDFHQRVEEFLAKGV